MYPWFRRLTEGIRTAVDVGANDGESLPIYPHSNEAHNFHVILSQANCPLVEYFPDVEPDTGNELFWKVFKGKPRVADGWLVPSDRPGLGIEIDWDAVERLR